MPPAALVPRLRVGFRGPLLAVVIRGERAFCQVQDFYHGHWKDHWIFEISLADGALLGAFFAEAANEHNVHNGPFAVAGDSILSPISSVLQAWRISTGAPLPVIGAPERRRRSIDYRAGWRDMGVGLLVDGGARALVQERDETLGLWDLEAGRRVGELRERMGPIQCAALHPDGARLAIATSSRLRLWHIGRGVAERSIGEVTGRTASLAFRPDGGALVACNPRGLVTTWNLERGGRPVVRAMLTRGLVYDAEGDRCAAVVMEPNPEPEPGDEGLLARVLRVWDVRTQEGTIAHRLPYLHNPKYGLGRETLAVGCLPGGRLVLQDHHQLTVFERGEAAAQLAGPSFNGLGAFEGDDEDAGEDLPFGSCGPPVVVWQAGRPGCRRVSTGELRATLRWPVVRAGPWSRWILDPRGRRGA